MEKDAIIEFARNFLAEPYSEEFLKNLAEKNHKKFLNNLSRLDERQINKVLKDHPEYANRVHDGWHSLHYACLLNNQVVLDKFMQLAIADGLKSLPRTEKDKKDTSAGLSLLNFCATMNCDKSFAKILTYLNNPEEQDFSQGLCFSILYNSTKTIKFIQKIMGPEKSQKDMLEFFNRARRNFQTNANYVLSNHFKYKPERFEDYGVDVNFKLDNLKNYFTLSLRTIADNLYEVEDTEKVKSCVVYFVDKGFNLDTPDGTNETPRTILENMIKNSPTNYFSNQLEKYIKEIEHKSLRNILEEKKIFEPKKLKI